MKKSSQPKLYLIIADALMLLAVLAIAYPNIVLMETMSAVNVAFCCILVLAGMAMVLAPYVFDYLNEKQTISNDAKKTRENIDLIFENLSALQLMIAETKEMGEQIEEKLAFQLAKDTDMKFDVFQEGIEKLRENIKTKIREIREEISELHARVADSTAQSETATFKIEEISETLATLKDAVEALEQTSQQTTTEELEAPEQSQEFAEDAESETSFENLDEKTEEASEEIEEETEDAPQELTYEIEQDFDEVSEPTEPENVNDEDEDFEDENVLEDAEENTSSSKLSGLMSKALGNAMSIAPSVEKIISDATIVSDQSADEQNDDEAIEQNLEETSSEDIQENSSDFSDDILADIDFDDEKKTDELQSEPSSQENLDIQTEQIATEETKIDDFDDMLFDIPAENKKARASKKDTVITLKALIGIGNKPYLRGDNSLLRCDKGTPMDYVEIGVWRAILPPFENSLNFSIWKNDELQIGENSYEIESGQKQEITL